MGKDADQDYMQRAIRQATLGRTPFGCVIVKDGKVISEAFNTVTTSYDPSAHGEINALRQAGHARQTHQLTSATLYTTGEPCPMCLSAILYADVSRVVYGASISTIARFMPQIRISSSEVASRSSQSVIIDGPYMESACISLLEQFS